jgi:hypothetical protein
VSSGNGPIVVFKKCRLNDSILHLWGIHGSTNFEQELSQGNQLLHGLTQSYEF